VNPLLGAVILVLCGVLLLFAEATAEMREVDDEYDEYIVHDSPRTW
jgi:hypothetical protein